MDGKQQGELILFPKTIDYYQIELTKLLEKEAYGEAIRLLEFLVECRTDDGRTHEEWSTLLHWLKAEFSQHSESDRPDDEHEDDGEEQLRRQYISAKASQDRGYAKRLMESLEHSSIDKQLLALDGLTYVDEPDISDGLLLRLARTQLHPFVSFKLLQTLCRRGVTGDATFGKLGEIVTVDVERTPLTSEQFPSVLIEVYERVAQMAEIDDPTLSYFAKETWQEFLAYTYGTALYREMTEMSEGSIDIWASALHTSVAETLHGTGNGEEERERYGVTAPFLAMWHRAYGALQQFLRENAGFNV